MVSALRKVHAAGGELKLCGVSKPVCSLFELVRMDKVFEIFENVDDATASFEAVAEKAD